MGKKKEITLYMEVSNDELELPILIADSVKELAGMLGILPNSISRELSRYYNKDIPTCKYRRVTIEEENENE